MRDDPPAIKQQLGQPGLARDGRANITATPTIRYPDGRCRAPCSRHAASAARACRAFHATAFYTTGYRLYTSP
jgi:hypothetical protein